MQDKRPDPDRILHQIQQQEADAAHVRGRLKIFFGYAAGVGKTYAMLEAAHAALAAGTDVVAGYIEPHTRPDTLALLEGLEQLPPLCVEYKNVTLREFDLDAAIARRPALLLVDELAHTNAEGCRHRKRCQDHREDDDDDAVAEDRLVRALAGIVVFVFGLVVTLIVLFHGANILYKYNKRRGNRCRFVSENRRTSPHVLQI